MLVLAGFGVVAITVAFMSSDPPHKISIGFVGYVDGTNGVKYAKFIGTNLNTRPIHYDMSVQRKINGGWPTQDGRPWMSLVYDWGPAQAEENIIWFVQLTDDQVALENGTWRIYVRYETYLSRLDMGRIWLADFLNRHKFAKTARLVWTYRPTSVAYGPEMRK